MFGWFVPYPLAGGFSSAETPPCLPKANRTSACCETPPRTTVRASHHTHWSVSSNARPDHSLHSGHVSPAAEADSVVGDPETPVINRSDSRSPSQTTPRTAPKRLPTWQVARSKTHGSEDDEEPLPACADPCGNPFQISLSGPESQGRSTT